ncbi:MAG: beta-propeller fold lactonase family protein, partial [Pseudolabrys sp.]
MPAAPYGSGGKVPIGIAIDPNGEFLFVANGESDGIAVFRIDASTGVPAMITGGPFESGQMPCGVVAEPAGQFLYATNWVSNDVSCWRIERSTGTLQPVDN